MYICTASWNKCGQWYARDILNAIHVAKRHYLLPSVEETIKNCKTIVSNRGLWLNNLSKWSYKIYLLAEYFGFWN